MQELQVNSRSPDGALCLLMKIVFPHPYGTADVVKGRKEEVCSVGGWHFIAHTGMHVGELMWPQAIQ